MNGLIVDLFAGGGGTSLGIEMALGRSPDVAVNHDPEAVAMHAANHPATRHYCENVWVVDPLEATGGRPVALLWASPDCTHHSRAKGGKPLNRKRRTLAHVIIRWAREVRPDVIHVGNGENVGQAPRIYDIETPLGTVVASGQKHALVSAFLAKNYGGNGTPGSDLRDPMSTVTTQDHHALVRVPFAPLGADRRAEVRAFLMAYYGVDQSPDLRGPMPTVTTHDRFGLVTVAGEEYAIADIGMRMLSPRELFRAQGFPDSYKIDLEIGGRPLSKSAQVRLVGNSVAPPVAAAIVRANILGVGAEAGTEQLDLFTEVA